jgi:hypothetical protein
MLGLQSLNLSALVTGEPLAVPRNVEPEKNGDAGSAEKMCKQLKKPINLHQIEPWE